MDDMKEENFLFPFVKNRSKMPVFLSYKSFFGEKVNVSSNLFFFYWFFFKKAGIALDIANFYFLEPGKSSIDVLSKGLLHSSKF